MNPYLKPVQLGILPVNCDIIQRWDAIKHMLITAKSLNSILHQTFKQLSIAALFAMYRDRFLSQNGFAIFEAFYSNK